MRPALCLAVLLAAAALPLHAQVYKWVDAKGGTHYSDKPPADAQAKPTLVEDRLSVIPTDPALSAATAQMRGYGARQAELAQAEWLQRQQMMLAAQSTSYSYDCPYRMNCDYQYGYGYGYGYAYPPLLRPPHPPRPPHVRPPLRPMPVGTRPAPVHSLRSQSM
jgi:hypothetical protein